MPKYKDVVCVEGFLTDILIPFQHDERPWASPGVPCET